MPSAPPRRFAPTPVETTSRSSKQKDQQQSSEDVHASKRRFLTEPASTNTPETGDLHALKHEHKARRFVPEPVESSVRSSRDNKDESKENKPRRFAPQPVETTHKSSKDRKTDGKVDGKPRRFAPEPIETTHKSSKDKKQNPHIKFEPQLIETTHNKSTDRKVNTPRKFTPILIDTARRSRKAGDTKPAVNISDRTEQSHGLVAREHRRHITGVATPVDPDNEPFDIDAISEHVRRSRSPLDGSSRRAVSQQRQHSFRCPDLDTIESSESDRDSDTSSVPDVAQTSPITASDSSFNEFKHATRIRESVDENFAKYFLELEAKRAEKRLRDQALAAFPNSDFHEPIQHYVDVEKDSDSDVSIDYRPVTYDAEEDDVVAPRAVRRDSTKVSWEQLEMQRHAEKMDQERKANQVTAKTHSSGPWWNPEYDVAQPDKELRSMLDRARPPMLGSDISFPRCQSPEPARFDVTQGAAALRDQMSAERNASQNKRSADDVALWSDPNAKRAGSSGSSANGLWRGLCGATKKAPDGLEAPMMPSGLVTPRSESLNPFDHSFSLPHGVEMGGVAIQTPPTPGSIRLAGAHTINNILVTQHEMEKTLENEFPDSFVTQVYNYLSLGYPSLARPFDDELSKISHISLVELRADDEKAKATPRGYIRLGPDFEGGGGVEREESCMRWNALKRYVHEWARQEKDMSKTDGVAASWATAARRGSWGN